MGEKAVNIALVMVTVIAILGISTFAVGWWFEHQETKQCQILLNQSNATIVALENENSNLTDATLALENENSNLTEEMNWLVQNYGQIDIIVSVRPLSVEELTDILRRDSQVPLKLLGNKTLLSIGNKTSEELTEMAKETVGSGYGFIEITNKYESPLRYIFSNETETICGVLQQDESVRRYVDGRAVRGTIESQGDMLKLWVSKGTGRYKNQCSMGSTSIYLMPGKPLIWGEYQIPGNVVGLHDFS